MPKQYIEIEYVTIVDCYNCRHCSSPFDRPGNEAHQPYWGCNHHDFEDFNEIGVRRIYVDIHKKYPFWCPLENKEMPYNQRSS